MLKLKLIVFFVIAIVAVQISAKISTSVEENVDKQPNVEQNQEIEPNIPINEQIEAEDNIKEIVDNLLPYAKAITVKINLPQGFGSGVLLDREGKNYTIVTNAHVLEGGESPYQIETFDGNIYSANTVAVAENDRDLAIMQFYSPTIVYPIAQIGKLPQENDFTLAVGFREMQSKQENENNNEENIENNPENSNNEQNLPESMATNIVFDSLTGKVTFVLDKPLQEGYQIGYTNQVIDGMSGGAILNQKGELNGINGMRAYPIFGNPFIYEDESKPSESMRESMMKSSWGIPINIILELFSQIQK